MDESPADRTRLILTIQRQTETLDRLHAAIKEEKNTNQHLAQKIATLEVDNSKLSALKVENAEFRRELGHLQGLIADFQHRQEEVFTREALSLGKQNEMHQTEMRSLHDQISKSSHEAQLLRTTNAEKDARIAVLVDKLSSEGNEIEIKLQLEQMKDKTTELHKELKMRAEQSRALTTQSEHLKLSLESANEEIAQRDSMVQSLERENQAYKRNISQLINQKHGSGRGRSRSRDHQPSIAPTPTHDTEVYEPLFDDASVAFARGAPPPHPNSTQYTATSDAANAHNRGLSRLEQYRQRARRQ